MKTRRLMLITAMTLFATLESPVLLAAQGHTTHFRHYKFVNWGTFGGRNSGLDCCGIIPPVLSNQGVVVGFADTSAHNPSAAIGTQCFIARFSSIQHFSGRAGYWPTWGRFPAASTASPIPSTLAATLWERQRTGKPIRCRDSRSLIPFSGNTVWLSISVRWEDSTACVLPQLEMEKAFVR